MKQFLLAATIFFTTSAIAQAQQTAAKNIDKIAMMQLQQIKQKITDLSTGQSEALQKIFDEFGENLQSLNSQTGKSKMTAFKKINSKKDKAAKEVLNDEQEKIYEALQEEWKEKIQQRRKKTN